MKADSKRGVPLTFGGVAALISLLIGAECVHSHPRLRGETGAFLQQVTLGDHGGQGEHGGQEETPPETFLMLDLFSEAMEASIAGVGVKISEIKPKLTDIHEMYQNGEKHLAMAKALGISTEVVLVGFFVETFGIGEMFISALSFSGNWLLNIAMSTAGILASTKAATLAGEKVEGAVEHKYQEVIRSESTTHSHGTHRATH